MPITFKEAWDRELTYGATGGGVTVPLTALGSKVEADVYAAAIAYSPPYFLGFIRNDIRVTPLGGPVMRVEVEYGTTGLGGGGQPLGGADGGGGPPPNPTGPATDATPLTSGFSFSISAPGLHITQSLATISATRRGGGAAADFKGAIGVGLDGAVAGCEIPPPSKLKLKRTVARGTVTAAYLKTIRDLVGKVNDAQFYHQAAGEVFYTGAEGTFTQGEGWSITHEFGCEPNLLNVAICDGLVVPQKMGFHYLWVAYQEVLENGLVTTVPAQANVEKVLELGDFSGIGIGV